MKMTSKLTALSVALVTFASASTAQAAAARTFVSGTGSDSNAASDCPRPTPCRNFQAAHDVTLNGGEIIALDPNGYGTLVINRAITIVGAETAQVVVPASGTGITINAGGGFVKLQNIQVFGANRANTTGIALNSGQLIVQDSSLQNLTIGLSVTNSRADLIDTDIHMNATGVSTEGEGVDQSGPQPFTGTTQVRISGGSIVNNETAFFMNNPGTNASNSQNRITVIYDSVANTPFTYQAGNNTVVFGSGTGCDAVSECEAGMQVSRSTANNVN